MSTTCPTTVRKLQKQQTDPTSALGRPWRHSSTTSSANQTPILPRTSHTSVNRLSHHHSPPFPGIHILSIFYDFLHSIIPFHSFSLLDTISALPSSVGFNMSRPLLLDLCYFWPTSYWWITKLAGVTKEAGVDGQSTPYTDYVPSMQ